MSSCHNWPYHRRPVFILFPGRGSWALPDGKVWVPVVGSDHPTPVRPQDAGLLVAPTCPLQPVLSHGQTGHCPDGGVTLFLSTTQERGKLVLRTPRLGAPWSKVVVKIRMYVSYLGFTFTNTTLHVKISLEWCVFLILFWRLSWMTEVDEILSIFDRDHGFGCQFRQYVQLQNNSNWKGLTIFI